MMEEKKENEAEKKDKSGKFRRFQNSTLISVSVLLVLILLIAVTVTWFLFNVQTGTNGLSMKVSEWDFIVSKTSGGEPIGEGDTIDLNVDTFSNVNDEKIAPGTTGSITLYIRTATDVISNCIVRLDKSKLTLKVDNNNDYSDILSGHFYFYSDEAMTKEVSMDAPIIIDLVKGVEKEVKDRKSVV